MSHLSIYSNGQPLSLPADFSVDIDDQNPLFNDVEMFSYPVQMPMRGNRFLLGNIDDINNVDRPVGLEHTPMRILVDSAPFRSGTLVTTEDEEIADSLTMSISASEHSIDDLIGTLTCRDIPLIDTIQIGEKIGEVSASVTYTATVKLTFDGKKADTEYKPDARESATVTFSPQALGYSFPGICNTTNSECKEYAVLSETTTYDDGYSVNKPSVKQSFINVSEEYPYAKYCNARIAYYHYGIDDDGETSDSLNPITSTGGPENRWPYWVLDADRQQSGICFYVLYFLDCLFAYLNVSFDNSELLKVADMRRLCFFTTHCKYDEERKYSGDPDFDTIEKANAWLSSRGTGAQFEWRDGGAMNVNNVDYTDAEGNRHLASVGDGVASITLDPSVTARSFSASIMNMYANSDNFPDESVSTIIDSLFNSFGIKFEYDYEKKHVRAYFVRDVFRSQDSVIDFPGKVISMRKLAEKITGVRVCYSAESSSKEQQQNIKYGTKDYDTDYDYIDYPKKSTIIDKTYSEIFRYPNQTGAANNMNCYIDQNTGNAYRIKINGDASTASEMKPVLFEVGGYKGVELGDCSELNEDFVQELASDFQPVIFNDVNYQREILSASGTVTTSAGESVVLNPTSEQPIMSAFTDEDMEHEFIEHRISNSLASSFGEFYLDQVMNLVENYDPSNTDDGNSPLQSIDWGNAIAIMRGGGTDATIQQYDFNYDGFGSSRWRTVAGAYALTSDSLDMWGNEYDYNGTKDGTGDGERFSLKVRAYKQPDWADAPLVKDDIHDSSGNVTTKIKTRGLYDSFLSEYANFLLHRRLYRVSMQCSPAQIADVPNHWTSRFRINGLVGYINKLSYTLSVAQGVENLEVEFYVL